VIDVDQVTGAMGPPAYGRSMTVPYHKPLSLMERKMSQEQQLPPSSMCCNLKPNTLLVPEFSDFNNTFEVEIKRNSLGLGFSIDGGPDAPAPWTNLVRVKKIFPLQPAWETGKLRIGDILLRVSGVPLSGLSLRQALDILRSSPAVTLLQVCRVSDNSGNSWMVQPAPRSRSSIVRSYSYGPVSVPAMEGILTPRRPQLHVSEPESEIVDTSDFTPRSNLSLCSGESMDIEISPPSPSTSSVSSREWSPADDDSETLDILKPVEKTLKNSGSQNYGEFTISLTKVNGSLGFTLRQTDDTVLKHTIKALVKEPAISDGRLKPGDKLLTCNGVDLSNFSHQELISFLRQCPETNSLTLYRDASRSQTPLTPDNSCQFESLVAPAPTATLSPICSFESRTSLRHDKRTSQSPSRKHLRYEAAELVRSLQSSRNSLDKVGLGSNPGSYSSGTLGRRLGRPYSPAMKDRQLLLSPAPVSAPRVESPVTPHNSSAPPSLSHALTNLKLEHAVSIEEVDCSSASGSISGGCSPDIQEAVSPASAPHSPVKDIPSPLSMFNSNQSKSLPRGTSNHYLINSDSLFCENEKPERPNELNFNVDQNRKQAYIFNSNWNFNKNKY